LYTVFICFHYYLPSYRVWWTDRRILWNIHQN